MLSVIIDTLALSPTPRGIAPLSSKILLLMSSVETDLFILSNS